jgi:DNA-binding transcriptional regulator PaaX
MAKNKRLNRNTKIILKGILSTGGLLAIAAISPMLLPAFGILIKENEKGNRRIKNFVNTFYALKRRGLIKFEKKNNQIFISLTEEGKKRTGKYQIDDLKIERPRKWDRKWRIVIFDISSGKRIVREALRGKLKNLGFYQLQKSVWIHPFDCLKEVEFLKNFFGLSDAELRMIISGDIGQDREIKEKYKI